MTSGTTVGTSFTTFTTTTTTTSTSTGMMFAHAVALAGLLLIAATTAAPGGLGASSVGFPAYVRHVNAVQAHEMDSRFIQTMMLKDHLWRHILAHRVRLTEVPREPTDHYAVTGPREPVPVVVDPFREAVLLMASNSLAGTDVAFTMKAVRAAMMCSALQHLSLQGFLLHSLIAKDIAHAVQSTVAKWLERMLHATVDKLAAVDQAAPLVARMHFHVRELLVPNADLTANELRDISQQMYDEMGELCVMEPEGSGSYAALIRAFKQHDAAEQLNLLDEALSLDETAKDTADLAGIRELQDYHGKLDVDENVGPAGFDQLTEKTLKILLTVNRIKMDFVWLNLPIKTLAEPQWTNLFNLRALTPENENYQNL